MHICNLQVIDKSTNFATSVRIPANLTDDYLLYIEDMEPIEDCPKNVVAIHRHNSQCSSLIPHKNIGVNLRGNVSIAISEISNRQFETTKCFLADESNPNVNQTMPSCNVKKYDAVQTCDNLGSLYCRLSFPPNCTAALHHREVVLNCEGATRNRLIVYPTQMQTLDLTGRNAVEIEVGAFRNLNRLKNLYLGINQIHSLHAGVFNGLVRLTYLSLKQNNLDHLDQGLFNELKFLLVLNLDDNSLTLLPPDIFRSLTNLRILYIGSNNLQTVDEFQFTGLLKLEQLWLGYNQIVELPPRVLEDLISLTTLDLWNNKLANLDKNLFQNLTNLEILYLIFNQLKSVHVNTFADLSNLQLLYLVANEIDSLPDAQIFVDLKHLKVLALAENNLKALPQGLFEGLFELQVLALEGKI